MANYVSKDGLLYFWTLLKAKLNNKSEVGHTHTSDDVTTMGTYTKGSSTSAIATTDTLNQAIGKLEKRVDGKQASGTYVTASSATATETTLSTTSDAKVPTSKAVATYVTGLGYKTTDNDTKNTAGSTASTSKLFIVGATSQAANPQTYSNVNCYVGTDSCLYSNGSKVITDISGKQNSLTTAQLNACNSGITSSKVSTYDGYATAISRKADSADVYTKSEIDGKLTSAMRYKGSVAKYANLPTTDLTVGDMYNITETGANYVWDGSAWDETGMIVDLSPYAKIADLVVVTNTEIDTIVAS